MASSKASLLKRADFVNPMMRTRDDASCRRDPVVPAMGRPEEED